MNVFKMIVMLMLLSFLSLTAESQVRDNDEILAARGNGELTHEIFEARLNRIPEEDQFAFIRDRVRMEEMLDRLLLVVQLAYDAREAGFDQQPKIAARMELAATEELARAWMENYLENAEAADYTTMAREDYLINQDKYQTKETVDVSHILIKDDERSEEEALQIAMDLKAQLDEDPARFDELVLEYSEDSSKSSNKGSFTSVERGDMVPEFEETAFSLNVGEISEPVLSQYGYHLIRKDAANPARQLTFEEVQVGLEKRMQDKHLEHERRLYLNELYSSTSEVTQESVENTMERIFGPEVLAKYQEDQEAKK